MGTVLPHQPSGDPKPGLKVCLTVASITTSAQPEDPADRLGESIKGSGFPMPLECPRCPLSKCQDLTVSKSVHGIELLMPVAAECEVLQLKRPLQEWTQVVSAPIPSAERTLRSRAA